MTDLDQAQRRRRPGHLPRPPSRPQERQIKLLDQVGGIVVQLGSRVAPEVRMAERLHAPNEDGGLGFSSSYPVSFQPIIINEISRSGLLAERGLNSYLGDYFSDRREREAREAHGLHLVCSWHLHRDRLGEGPPDVPSAEDMMVWSVWRQELEAKLFVGLLAIVMRDGSLRFAPYVLRAGNHSRQDICQRAQLLA
jgi:hypothetical protein